MVDFLQLEHLNKTEIIDHDCWFYLLEPIKGLNMIAIYAKDFPCKEAEKKKIGECHSPRVTFFYVHPEASSRTGL